MKNITVTYSRKIENRVLGKLFFNLCELQAFESWKEIILLLKIIAPQLHTYKRIEILQFIQVFHLFPSFTQHGATNQENSSHIQLFVNYRTNIINEANRQSIQLLKFSKQKEIKNLQEKILQLIRTLAMLQYYQKGSKTQNMLGYLYIQFLTKSFKNIRNRSDDATLEYQRTLILEILQEVKIQYEEKCSKILNGHYQVFNPHPIEELYSQIKEAEQNHLTKTLNQIKQARSKYRAQIQESELRYLYPQFTIEDILLTQNLDFVTEYIIDINIVDIYIPSFNSEEFGLPSGDKFAIKVLKDEHYCKLAKRPNLDAESKMTLLKKHGYNVS